MPIVRIDVSSARDAETRHAISDGVHQALVAAVGIPEDDRFHILSVHDRSELIAHPTYLAIRDDVVFIQITLVGGRSRDIKLALYREVAQRVGAVPGVRPADVSVILTENGAEDWSWGNGEAQLLTLGKLPGT